MNYVSNFNYFCASQVFMCSLVDLKSLSYLNLPRILSQHHESNQTAWKFLSEGLWHQPHALQATTTQCRSIRTTAK